MDPGFVGLEGCLPPTAHPVFGPANWLPVDNCTNGDGCDDGSVQDFEPTADKP